MPNANQVRVCGFDLSWSNYVEPMGPEFFEELRGMRDSGLVEQCPSEYAWHFVCTTDESRVWAASWAARSGTIHLWLGAEE